MEYITPCIICNDSHKGQIESAKGHLHKDEEGVGFIRLLVLGNGKIEHCWRCGCQKSAWANIPNEISDHCTDKQCICHTADHAR